MKLKTKLVGLINIQDTVIDKSRTIETVSARELHTFLGVETKFNDWFRRMCEYGFVENTDYLLVAQKRATNNPRNPTTDFTDYAITLSMAKELAMIQRTDKGKEARQYFINCEQQLQDLRNDLQLKEKARQEARMEYKPMSTALKETRKLLGKDTQHFHYSNEANLINIIVMGSTAKKLKEDWGLDTLDNLRDELTPQQIAAVQDLQKVNTSLIDVGLTYDERKEKLNGLFNRKWSNILIEEHIRLEA